MKSLVISLFILTFAFSSYSQMSTAREHHLTKTVYSITQFKITSEESETSIVKDSGMDSSIYYFNHDDFVDSVHAYSEGKIVNRIFFKHENSKVIERQWIGQMGEQKINAKWIYEYNEDSVKTIMYNNNLLVRESKSYKKETDSTTISILGTHKSIASKDKYGFEFKTEIYEDDQLFQTDQYSRDENGLVILLEESWTDNRSYSIDHYEYKFDDNGNWIELLSFDIKNGKKSYSKSKTLRKIIY